MKKFTLFLSALLFSAMTFAAALETGYSKVTDITTLSAGDKVVLYCDDANLGVTGWNGNKDAIVAATGWVEYVVEIVADSVLLKDASAGQYIAMTAKNSFKYANSGSACKVNASGVLYCTKYGTDAGDYFLHENNNNGTLFYRMYKESTAQKYPDSYKPFYVYKVTGEVDENYVAPPTISGVVDFLESTEATITAEEGLKIYYTLNGEDPTTESEEYTEPIEILWTITVKAIAYDENGNASAVVEKTFKQIELVTCEEAVEACADAGDEKYIVYGYVTGIKSEYDSKYNNIEFWIADSIDGGEVLLAFRAKPTTDTDINVKVGDYVKVFGNLQLYTNKEDDSKTPEIINATYSVFTSETINLVDAEKTIQSRMWSTNLILTGTDATHGEVIVTLPNFYGYGECEVTLTLGENEFSGLGVWANEGETDKLTATALDDENTTLYNITVTTPAPKLQEYTCEDATYYAKVYSEENVQGVIEGVTKEDELPFRFDVYNWNGRQAGEYEVYCTLGETDLSGTATITVTETNITCVAELSDAIQNPYKFTITATPKIPTKETITFTDMIITPDPWSWSDNITITAENDEHSIELILAGGKNKGYGEYGFANGYAEVYDVYLDYTLIDMAPNTVAVYSLDEENNLAKFEGTFINGIDTLVISMTGAPYVDPATIVPTDTIDINMYEGQIYLKYGFLTIEGKNKDYNLAITLVDGDAHEGVTTADFAKASILTVNADASQISFLHGTLTVNETDDTATAGLLGSDHVWYNIMVTTKEAPVSAVDNITTTVAPQKVIRNGQLIIIKNGVEYNVVGAVIK